MIAANPVVDRYMHAFADALARFDCPDHSEIVHDLRGHIDEAQAMGKPLDAVLQSIGPAETLARAYAVELALNPRSARWLGSFGKGLQLLGIVAAGSIVTLVVVGTLGSVGVGFTISGLMLFTIGLLEAAGVHLPFVQMGGMSPLLVTAIGPLLFVVGAVSLALLSSYIRALVRGLRSLLPKRR